MNAYDPRYLVVVLNHGRGHLFARKEAGSDLRLVGSLAEATQFTKDRAIETATGINRTSPCCVRDIYVYRAECHSNQAALCRLLGVLPAENTLAAEIPAHTASTGPTFLEQDDE